MKKIKLLAPVLGTATIAATLVPAMTSCNSGLNPGTAITPTIIENDHVYVKCTAVKAFQSFKIRYYLDDGYILDDISIKVGNSILAKNIDFTVSDNVIVVNKDAVNSSSIKVSVTAKADESEEFYVKDHSYLCENLYIETEENAISHEIKFGLKSALESGQKLVARIIEVPEGGDSILKNQGAIDLTDFTFGNIVYVPIKYYSYVVRWTQIAKFQLVLSCINDQSEVVWSDTYDTMYIKFNAINAWAGYDFRGNRNDFTRMDTAYYVINLGASGNQQATFPFPVELREKVYSANEELHAQVFNSVVYASGGKILDNMQIGMQNVDTELKLGLKPGNWVRQPDGSEQKFAWTDITTNIEMDPTDTRYETSYDLRMTLQYNGTDGQHTEGEPISSVGIGTELDHANGVFDVVVWKTNKTTGEIIFAEVFSGCKMTFIPSGMDQESK